MIKAVCSLYAAEKGASAKLVKELRDGLELKFVPMIRADLLAGELVLVLAIGGGEHEDILGYAHSLLKAEDLLEVSTKPTGGKVKIKGKNLVFFGYSQKYGDFDPNLLKRLEPEIKKLFEVEVVRYE
jgi:hypothetical protein